MVNGIPALASTPKTRTFHGQTSSIKSERRKRSLRGPLEVIRSNQVLSSPVHVSSGKRPRPLPRTISLMPFEVFRSSAPPLLRRKTVHVALDNQPSTSKVSLGGPFDLSSQDSIISDSTEPDAAVNVSSPLADLSNRSPLLRRASLPRMIMTSPVRSTQSEQPTSPLLLSRVERRTSSAKLRENRRPIAPTGSCRRPLASRLSNAPLLLLSHRRSVSANGYTANHDPHFRRHSISLPYPSCVEPGQELPGSQSFFNGVPDATSTPHNRYRVYTTPDHDQTVADAEHELLVFVNSLAHSTLPASSFGHVTPNDPLLTSRPASAIDPAPKRISFYESSHDSIISSSDESAAQPVQGPTSVSMPTGEPMSTPGDIIAPVDPELPSTLISSPKSPLPRHELIQALSPHDEQVSPGPEPINDTTDQEAPAFQPPPHFSLVHSQIKSIREDSPSESYAVSPPTTKIRVVWRRNIRKLNGLVNLADLDPTEIWMRIVDDPLVNDPEDDEPDEISLPQYSER